MSKNFTAVHSWMLNFDLNADELYLFACIYGLTEYNGGLGFTGTISEMARYFHVEDYKRVLNAFSGLEKTGLIAVKRKNDNEADSTVRMRVYANFDKPNVYDKDYAPWWLSGKEN